MKTQASTQSVHGGEKKRKAYDALTTPIVQTSTYTFENTAAILSFLEQKADRKKAREAGGDLPLRGEYGRYGNPTTLVAERKLAALEGGVLKRPWSVLMMLPLNLRLHFVPIPG